jgi:hypothetical protein
MWLFLYIYIYIYIYICFLFSQVYMYIYIYIFTHIKFVCSQLARVWVFDIFWFIYVIVCFELYKNWLSFSNFLCQSKLPGFFPFYRRCILLTTHLPVHVGLYLYIYIYTYIYIYENIHTHSNLVLFSKHLHFVIYI